MIKIIFESIAVISCAISPGILMYDAVYDLAKCQFKHAGTKLAIAVGMAASLALRSKSFTPITVAENLGISVAIDVLGVIIYKCWPDRNLPRTPTHYQGRSCFS